MAKTRFLQTYSRLLDAWGPQGWWPLPSHAGKEGFDERGYRPSLPGYRLEPFDRFQVCLGTILTQNTAWTNAERALLSLLEAGVGGPEDILSLSASDLERLVRPSGYFRQKAERLKLLCLFLRDGSFLITGRAPARDSLLSLKGVGPETADSMLLYAFGVSAFVIDAYTLRLGSRMGFFPEGTGYAEAQELFGASLPEDVPLYAEYHALIVRACKDNCRKRDPDCSSCPLKASCPSAGKI